VIEFRAETVTSTDLNVINKSTIRRATSATNCWHGELTVNFDIM